MHPISSKWHPTAPSVTPGHINRDGKDDIIVGADNAAGGEGEAYVIFGASFCSTTDFIMTPITQTHIATHPTYTPVLPDATHTGASFPIYAIAVIAVGAIGIATAVTGTMYLKMAGLYCHSQSIQEVHEDYILG